MIRNATLVLFCAALAAPACTQKPGKDDAVTKKDVAVQAVDKFLAGKGKPGKSAQWRQSMTKPEVVEFDKDHEYFWHMKTTKGEIKIRLMPEVAPMHVTSTMYLVRAGYYDDLKFHRVIKGFMAQGGCPIGNGRGGPGYKYAGECDRSVKHTKPGMLSMANAGPNTDGSQFFLTFVPTPHLDMRHTVFGEIVEGMDVLKAIESVGARGDGPPSEELKMQQNWISVAEKPKAEEKGDAKEDAPAKKGDGGDKKEGK